MMETAAMHSPTLGSQSLPNKPGNLLRDPRTPRFHVDAFHSPFELSSRSSHPSHPSIQHAPRSLVSHEDTAVSPTGMPSSFSALRESAHSLSLRIGRSPGPSPRLPPGSTSTFFRTSSDRNPSLTIRRAPNGASLPKDTDNLHFNEYSIPQESGHRHHRRRRTGSLSDSLPQRDIQTDDMMFPVTVDDIHLCDENHCSNHHHRQSSSSIVSIKCDKSDDDSDSNSIYGMDHIEGDIETSIPMAPMAPLMLVPLIDRPVEMAELLDHRANKRWVGLVKHSVGDEQYRNQCLPLWTGTSRSRCPDIAWLRRSKDLLITKSCGGNKDGRLWSEFCDMVGWSESDINLDDDDSHRRPSVSPRRGSQDGSGSPQMMCILEEE